MPDTGTGALDSLFQPVPLSPEELALMRRIDELHLELPFAGAWMLSKLLKREGKR